MFRLILFYILFYCLNYLFIIFQSSQTLLYICTNMAVCEGVELTNTREEILWYYWEISEVGEAATYMWCWMDGVVGVGVMAATEL